MSAVDDTLPLKVLCLHGAGSSGPIFKAQGRGIFRTLHNEITFDFVNAPFPSTPGPGMRPIYEDSGPFWRWQCDMSAVESFDITEDEVLAERDQVREMILRQLRKMGCGVIGIMAFSQGARVATGLLLYLERLRQVDKLAELKLPSIGFVVLNSATFPPLHLDQATEDWTKSGGRGDDASMDEGTSGLRVASERKVTIPSLHLCGSTDPWRPESEKMKADFFAGASSSVIEFTGGHQLPIRAPDTSQVVAAIRGYVRMSLGSEGIN